MAHIWNALFPVNQQLAKTLIEDQCNIPVTSIEILGSGFDNIAYLINRKLVFRFPQRDAALPCMENEITLVPYIAKNVSFSLTAPEFIGNPSSNYPYPFSGYYLIRGNSLSEVMNGLIDDHAFARSLALWLGQLHAIPVLEEHYKQIKGDLVWRLGVANRVKRSTENLNEYEAHFIAAGFSKKVLQDCIDTIAKLHFTPAKSSYLHGDLYGKHILVDNDFRPCALIDWGDVHIGHPGIDLSIGIMLFNDATLQTFFASYGNLDEETETIAVFRAFCHSMTFIPYCYEKKDEKLKALVSLALQQAVKRIENW